MIRLTKFSWTAIALAAVAVLLSIVLAWQAQRAVYYEGQLAAIYRKSFFDCVDLVANIEVNLEKLMISADRSYSEQLLSNIARQADNAQGNLSTLPLSDEAVSGTMKFVNQVGDFSRVRMATLSQGQPMSDENHATLNDLRAQCARLNQSLSHMVASLEHDGAAFFGNLDIKPMSKISLETVEYPELIYDGPFSDGENSGIFRALPNGIIDENGAIDAARVFLGERALSLSSDGQSLMPIPCFNVNARTQQGELSLVVTQNGGRVLMMVPGSSVEGTTNASDMVCLEVAQAFLVERGFGICQAGFFETYGGMIMINFMPIVENIVMYPDMIKVQVSRFDGSVVGFDAGAYYRNHVPRDMMVAALTIEDSAGKLADALYISGQQLCVIPTDTGEKLCYEFITSAGGAQFYIYIDAFSGEELKIYKIISQDAQRKAI